MYMTPPNANPIDADIHTPNPQPIKKSGDDIGDVGVGSG